MSGKLMCPVKSSTSCERTLRMSGTLGEDHLKKKQVIEKITKSIQKLALEKPKLLTKDSEHQWQTNHLTERLAGEYDCGDANNPSNEVLKSTKTYRKNESASKKLHHHDIGAKEEQNQAISKLKKNDKTHDKTRKQKEEFVLDKSERNNFPVSLRRENKRSQKQAVTSRDRRSSYPPRQIHQGEMVEQYLSGTQSAPTQQRRLKLIKSCPMLRGDNGHWQQQVVVQEYHVAPQRKNSTNNPIQRRQRDPDGPHYGKHSYARSRISKDSKQLEPKRPKPPSWQSLPNPGSYSDVEINSIQRAPSVSCLSEPEKEEKKEISVDDEFDSESNLEMNEDAQLRTKVRPNIKRTRCRKIDKTEIPKEKAVVRLSQAKPSEYHLKETQFDNGIYLRENAIRCQRWLESLTGASQVNKDDLRLAYEDDSLNNPNFSEGRWVFVSSPYPSSHSSDDVI